MKKILLLVIITMTSLIKVSAQMEIEGAIDGNNNGRQYHSSIAIPPEFCKNNTPYIVLESDNNNDNEYDDQFTVLNENLETVKSVTLNKDITFTYQLKYQEKSRQIKSVTKVDSTISKTDYTWEETKRTELNVNPGLTPESFIYNIQANGDSIIYEKPTGSYYSNMNFFNYDYFGDKYPKAYWKVSKGIVYIIRTNYHIEYTDWTVTGTRTEDNSKSTLPIPICYINLNEGNCGPNFEFYLTQTLFNQDDNFEYIIPKYTLINTSSSITPDHSFSTGDDETISLTSETLIPPSSLALSGFKVINEEGNVISETDFNSPFETYYYNVRCAYLIRIGSKLYLAFDGDDANSNYATYFYEINNTTSSIKQVKAANFGMNIINKNDNYQSHSFDITFKDGNSKASELVATSTNGEILNKVKVPQGQTSTQLSVVAPKGVAIITRLQNGKAIESKKVVLK